MPKKKVLITGTTSGIGCALAEKFARNNYDLILVSRSQQKLELQRKHLQDKFSLEVDILAVNLVEDGAVDLITDFLTANRLQVDILVNNAGFASTGYFSDNKEQAELDMIKIHIEVITQLTKRILPQMLQRGSGYILNLGSTGSFIPVHKMAVYTAAKAYTLAFTKALYGELLGTGVHVCALCPGPTDTPFAQKAAINETLLFKIWVMEAKTVADIAYEKLFEDKVVIIPGLMNKVQVALYRILPDSLFRTATKWLMNSKH